MDLSVGDLFDRKKPWVLVEGGSFAGFFDFVPEGLRIGPWSKVASSLMVIILSVFVREALNYYDSGTWIEQFDIDQSKYEYVAFNREWYITLATFLWMNFICWHIVTYSHAGFGAWCTFTVWSWTTILIRHGLCLAVPFLPILQLPIEILRFPVLLSATITFFMWNFVLFPIIIFFIKDKVKRKKFFDYMTNFRVTQLHVFNIFFASANAAILGPKRSLHEGDVLAASSMIILYLFVYYGVLDRLGVHLYPIFSPRTPLIVFSFLILVGICYAGFQGWQKVLLRLQ